MGNSRELSCTTDDQNIWCRLVPPVWRQAPARKDMFQPSQRVHTGPLRRKVTHAPWGQQHSNTVIQQFHHFPYAFVPSVPTVHHRSVCRDVHRKRTSTDEGLKIIFSLLGLLLLLSLGLSCQISHNSRKVCVMRGQHLRGWDQWVMRLLGRAGAETGSGACWRHLWRAGCRELAKMPPNTRGKLALGFCISTFQGKMSAATE